MFVELFVALSDFIEPSFALSAATCGELDVDLPPIEFGMMESEGLLEGMLVREL